MLNKTISGTLLIAGTTIGAGMLGIPLLTAQAGFGPAVGITVLVWLFMLATGLLFLEATLWMHRGANVLSMSNRFLGRSGKVAAGSTFLFLYYCLMVAYFAGGAPIFAEYFQLSGPLAYLVFGVIFGTIVALGLKLVDRLNYLLMVAMFGGYFALIAVGTPEIEMTRLAGAQWSKIFFATPVLFASFGFHNVIPSLVKYFDGNVKVVRRSIFGGTFISLIVYLIWQWLIIGAVPANAITDALQNGVPATSALQALTGNPWVIRLGQFFGFFAMVTSMLGVAFSMVDFMHDSERVQKFLGSNRAILTLAVFLPPLVLSLYFPDIFLTALGFAGGFGEAFLNGLLPVSMVWVGRYFRKLDGHPQIPGGKSALAILFGLALSVAISEILFVVK